MHPAIAIGVYYVLIAVYWLVWGRSIEGFYSQDDTWVPIVLCIFWILVLIAAPIVLVTKRDELRVPYDEDSNGTIETKFIFQFPISALYWNMYFFMG